MKRICILLMGAAVFLSSCNTVNKTARTADTQSNLKSATVVDIVPATEQRVTHTVHPSKALLRGGENNVKQAVEHEALVKYGNADILLEPQYIVEKERRLFRTKITSVTVSGRPAYYTNYRALHDSVWANPVFNGMSLPPSKAMPFVGNKMGAIGLKRNPSNTPAYRTKGFAKYLTPFLGGSSWFCEHADGGGVAFATLLTLGYQFNPYFYLGVGAGFNACGGPKMAEDYYYLKHGNLRAVSVPIFANARINLSKKRNTLFFDGKYGSSVIGTAAVGGRGYFCGLAAGYSLGDVDIALQYLCNVKRNYTYEERRSSYWGDDYWYDQNEDVGLSQYGISVSFRF